MCCDCVGNENVNTMFLGQNTYVLVAYPEDATHPDMLQPAVNPTTSRVTAIRNMNSAVYLRCHVTQEPGIYQTVIISLGLSRFLSFLSTAISTSGSSNQEYRVKN